MNFLASLHWGVRCFGASSSYWKGNFTVKCNLLSPELGGFFPQYPPPAFLPLVQAPAGAKDC